MNILGLDNGYKFTKTSKRVCIHSTIRQGVDTINDDVTQVNVGDINYIVGEQTGRHIADADKMASEENKEVLWITTLTSIGLSFPTDILVHVNLVVGVPAAYYDKQKDDLKKLLEHRTQKIKINGVDHDQTIMINEVSVFPQGAGVVFKKAKKLKKETTLVIDVGGGTWDVLQFNGLKLESKATYQEGMMILYEKIAQALNTTHYTRFEAVEIYDIIERGYFTVNGTRHDKQEFESIIKDHVHEVMTKIIRSFDIINIDNTIIIGGGAEQLESYIKKYIDHADFEDDGQFVNADCFEYMGKLKRK